MAFDSFDAFIVMDGHGPYVWACYFVFFALSFVLVVWSRYQRKSALRGLADRDVGAGDLNKRPGKADFSRVDPSKH